MKLRVLTAAAVLTVLAYPLPSFASFHSTKINEVFAGSQYDAAVQYIEIKAFSAAQNQFNGQVLHVFDRNNVETAITFDHSVANSASQMTVLIATQAAATRLNVTPDFTINAIIDRVGGKVCFTTLVDCFAWGSFNGAAGSGVNAFGNKYDPTNGLPLDQAVIRNDGGNGLQDTDDTNDSAADFAAGTPTPRNNAGVIGDYLANCGNGAEDSGEDCDDANTVNNDACSVRCKDAECGDGITQTTEECDDGNSTNTDACRNDCQLPDCGDGVLSTGEQCEPPNTATCTSTCLIINVGCGDGQPDAGEQCDDGNTVSNDGCRGNCTDEVCGDGIVDFDEDCDDGNTVSGDTCRGDCQNAGCGDSVVDSGETCDDGNTTAGDGCDATCIIEEAEHDQDDGDHDHDDDAAEDDGCAQAKSNVAWLGVLLALAAVRVRRRT